MTLIQAFMWNLGTCRGDAKGAFQVAVPQEIEYQCTTQGRNNS